MARTTPLLLDVKRNSLDDGPGIRSVVFFKGCPLRCVWCQNPESLRRQAEIQRDVEACVDCSACAAACPQGVAQPGDAPEQRAECELCAACVAACPARARRIAGEPRTVSSLLNELTLDEPFYRRSGGGVTLSGGEPTLFVPFAAELAAGLRDRGIHVLLETCGHVPFEPFAAELLPHLSTVYFDLKLAAPDDHRRHCGTDNRRILRSFRRLAALGSVELLPRIPLVPGITDTPDNLAALGRIIGDTGIRRVALLPYNPLWLAKRRGLGLPPFYEHDRFMPPEEVRRAEQVMIAAGLELVR